MSLIAMLLFFFFFLSICIHLYSFFTIDCKEHLKTFSLICSTEMNKLTTQLHKLP